MIKEDKDPKVYTEKISKSPTEEWQSKPMHSQFLRQTKNLPSMVLGNGFGEGN